MLEVYRTMADVPGTIPNPAPAPPAASLLVDRDTGTVTITNLTGSTSEITSYTITSDASGLDVAAWVSIADNADADNGGSFDSTNVWNVTSAESNLLSEESSSSTSGGDLAAAGVLDLGEVWLKTPFEDLTFSFTLADGSTGGGAVRFTGNGGLSYVRSDLNADGVIDAADWELFYPNTLTDLSGLGLAEAYLKGDLDEDLDNDFTDFRIFKDDFIAANGQAAWNALVPEPGTFGLLLLGLFGIGSLRNRRWRVAGPAAVGLALLSCLATSPNALAGVTVFDLGSVDDTGCCGVYNRVTFTGEIEPGDPTPIRLDAPTSAGPSGDVGPVSLTDGATLSWSNVQGWNNGVFGEPNAATESFVHGSVFLIKDANPNPATFTIQTLSPSDEVEVFFLGGSGRDAQVTFDTNSPVIVPSYAEGQNPPNDTWHSVGMVSGATSYTGLFEVGNMPGSPPDLEGNLSAMRVSIVSNFEPLSLEVDTLTGEVRLQNGTVDQPFIDYYEITSAGGALDVTDGTGWMSLHDQGFDGSAWNEAGGSNSTALAELSLAAAGSQIETTTDLSLGNAFNPNVFGAGTDGDLVFKYGVVGLSQPITGTVNYVSSTPNCDFDGSGTCTIDDLNAMLAEGPIMNGVAVTPGVNDEFDLNGDNVIDNADRDLWLSSAAAQNGLGSPYKIGDANLDGFVDVSDFNAWNGAKFTSNLRWDRGDFNGDGFVEVPDFNAWNNNKFQSSDGVASVPSRRRSGSWSARFWPVGLCVGDEHPDRVVFEWVIGPPARDGLPNQPCTDESGLCQLFATNGCTQAGLRKRESLPNGVLFFAGVAGVGEMTWEPKRPALVFKAK